MLHAKTELRISLRTDCVDNAYLDLRTAISADAYHRDQYRLIDRVLVSHEQAQVLRHSPVDHTNASIWDALREYCTGLRIELVALEPLRVVARYDVEIAVPRAPDQARRDLWVHWGYLDGRVNRPEAYPGQAAKYGLGGDLVPAKWPEPPGLQDASWRLSASQRQVVTVELLSDGTRRIAGVSHV